MAERGGKTGSGGIANPQLEAIDRRERLRQLALETIDLAKVIYKKKKFFFSYVIFFLKIGSIFYEKSSWFL